MNAPSHARSRQPNPSRANPSRANSGQPNSPRRLTRLGALLALACTAMLAGPLRAQFAGFEGLFGTAVVRGTQVEVLVEASNFNNDVVGVDVVDMAGFPNGRRASMTLVSSGDAFVYLGQVPASAAQGTNLCRLEATMRNGSTMATSLDRPVELPAQTAIAGQINGTGDFRFNQNSREFTGRFSFNPPIPAGTTGRIENAQGAVIGPVALDLRSGAFGFRVSTIDVAQLLAGNLFAVFDDGTDAEIGRGQIDVGPFRRIAVGDGSQAVPPTASAGTVFAESRLLEDDRLSVQIVVIGIQAVAVDVSLASPGQNGARVFRPLAIAPNLFFDVSPPLGAAERAAYLSGDLYVEVFAPLASDKVRGQLIERPADRVFGAGCPGLNGERATVMTTEGPLLGLGVTFALNGAAPNAPALHFIGFDEGPYPSLANIGFRGCVALIQPTDTRGLFTTSPIGTAEDFLPIPPFPQLVGARVYGQWAMLENGPVGVHLSLSRAIMVRAMAP